MDKIAAVDAHHHLWDLAENDYPWLVSNPETDPFENFGALCQDYLVGDFRADIRRQNIVKSVHVQAEHDESDPVRETRWLQHVAESADSGGFPNAIVAWADLSQPCAEAILEAHCDSPNVRGIRQMLNYTPETPETPETRDTPPSQAGSSAARGGDKTVEVEDGNVLGKHGDLLSNDTFMRQFSLLRKFDLSFDMQIFPWQTAQGARLVADHADTSFILNHTIMPFDRSEEGLAIWRDALSTYAGLPNVLIKISGLGMVPGGWDAGMNRRLVRETIDVFSPSRCLFASNFPVDKLMSDYDTIWGLFREVIADLSIDEQTAMLRTNAERAYRI